MFKTVACLAQNEPHLSSGKCLKGGYFKDEGGTQYFFKHENKSVITTMVPY